MWRKLTPLGKFILIYFLSFTLLVVMVVKVNAAEATFTWTPNTVNTTGYKLVMDSGSNVIQDIPGIESNTVTVTITDECHSFAIFAYNDATVDNVSLLSDFATWCPPSPNVVGAFLITVEQVK